jgi:mono/diheme cytochrome c family protein
MKFACHARLASFVCQIALLGLAPALHAAAEAVPGPVRNILSQNCVGCHDGDSAEGGINLNRIEIAWDNPKTIEHWYKVFKVIDHSHMPPPEETQLSRDAKKKLLAFLDEKLQKHTNFGGTLPRRLNRLEYQNTIRTTFLNEDFELPLGFPKDNRQHGFDTVSEALVLSPPLLAAYQEVAQQIADEVFPPVRALPEPTRWTAGVDDLVLSFSASTIHGDALRLACHSADSIMRSSTWLSKIEIQTSGTYRVTVEASTFRPRDDRPLTLEIRARDLSTSDRSSSASHRLLETFEINSETPEKFTFDAVLYEGQTLLFRWADAELSHDPKVFRSVLETRFREDPRFLAAWQEMLFPGRKRNVSTTTLRGRNGWEIYQRHLHDSKLNLSDATMDSKWTQKILSLADDAGKVRNLGDTLTYEYHEFGPALELHGVTIEGPFALVDGPKEIRSDNIREYSFGKRGSGESDESYARRGIQSFLTRLFRRPVDAATTDTFFQIAHQHWNAGYTFDEGMHLMLRQALVSPRFLYREMSPGELDQHDLAGRIAYFLTRYPPTSQIVLLARAGKLSDPAVLRSEIERLIPTSPSAPMIRDFTEQWLHTRLLPEIMPDASFGFTAEEVELAKIEAERFFAKMIEENRPMKDWIAPDFLLTSRRFAEENYDYPPGKEPLANATVTYREDHMKIQRLPIDRNDRFGGVLGISATMMATANGVDTQPVLRGAWVLENIIGMPPPPVPTDVPALTPDVQGSTTPRELLAAHTSSSSCAGCHRHIDPIGFALENFDPVGRWRDKWPKVNAPIDSSGVLFDGTRIDGYLDFKKWLVANIDLFSECLAEKLMIFATGRVPSYAEQVEIAQIVDRVEAEEGGFRDLLVALIESRMFRMR